MLLRSGHPCMHWHDGPGGWVSLADVGYEVQATWKELWQALETSEEFIHASGGTTNEPRFSTCHQGGEWQVRARWAHRFPRGNFNPGLPSDPVPAPPLERA